MITFVSMVLLWLASITGFAALFSDTRWTLPLVLATIVPLSIEFSIVRLRRTLPPERARWLRPSALVLHFVAFLTVVAWTSHPETLFLGLPTPASLRAISSGVGQGMALVQESIAPLGSTPYLTIATGAVWWCAAASGAGMWSSGGPALAVAPPVTIFVATRVIADGKAGGAPLWLVVALAGVAVVAADYDRYSTRWARAIGPAVVIGIVLALGTLLGPALPGYGSSEWLNFRNRVGTKIPDNPFVDIRPRLVDLSPVEVFRVRAERSSYWRLTSLDTWDGRVWRTSDTPPTLPVPDPSTTTSLQQTVVITRLDSPWLPVAPFPAAPTSETRLDLRTGAVVVPNRTRPDTAYTIVSDEPTPAEDLLRAAPQSPSRGRYAPYLAAKELPDPVERWLDDVTGDAPTRFDAALALQDEFQTFTYDLNVTPGHSGRDLERFLLETRAGYCEQFASAMAILARRLGIPARVAIGYIPGEELRDNQGRLLFRVRGNDAHAWPELYFEGAGWVRFEPTPQRGTASPFQTPQGQDEQPPTTRPAPPPALQNEPPAGEPPPGTAGTPGDTASGTGDGRSGVSAWWALLVPAIPALIAATKVSRRGLRRRHGIDGAWREAVDTVIDCGVDVSPSETPLEIAARGALIGCDVEPVAVAFTTELYTPASPGGDGGTRAWRALDRARHDAARTGLRRRLALWFSPRTLLPARLRRSGREKVAQRDWRERSDVPFTESRSDADAGDGGTRAGVGAGRPS